jgi:hypothetical protein
MTVAASRRRKTPRMKGKYAMGRICCTVWVPPRLMRPYTLHPFTLPSRRNGSIKHTPTVAQGRPQGRWEHCDG